MLKTKKDIRTNSDLQNKAKDWAKRIQQNTGVNSGTPEGFAGPTPIEGLVVLLLNHIWYGNCTGHQYV